MSGCQEAAGAGPSRSCAEIARRVTTGTHVLKLLNFEQLRDSSAKGDDVRGPQFAVGGHPWRLVIYPMGRESSKKEKSLAVYLFYEGTSDADVRATFKLSATVERELSEHVSESTRLSSWQWLRAGSTFATGTGQGWGDAYKKEALEGLAGTLVLTVRVTVHGELELTETVETGARPVAVPPPALGASFLALLQSGDMSDVTLTAQPAAAESEGDSVPDARGASIAAHKNILAARSEVFAAMFRSGMREAGSGAQVAVTGVAPHVLRALLHYIYSDQPPGGALLPSSPLDHSDYA